MCLILVLSANVVAEDEPLIGQWLWFNGLVVAIHEDGTATHSAGERGTWRRVAGTRLKKYVIKWGGGEWVETLTLSKDARKLSGETRKLSGPNQTRMKSSADRIVLTKGQIVNPVARYGNDPWVIQKNGLYYYCYSYLGGIWINVDRTLQGAVQIGGTKIWAPEGDSPYSKNIWGPELHFLQDRWYVYFAADDGRTENHRMYVLESKTQDPLGKYAFSGKISDQSDQLAIDGTVLEHAGQLYFIWSGWEGYEEVQQNLYIAQMKDPKTIVGARKLISKPEYNWEKVDRPFINEAPAVLKNQGHVFVIYSASGSWGDNYCLGQLELTGKNPLNRESWTKTQRPVFKGTSTVFSPGAASFVKSPNGKEDWMVYHTAIRRSAGWDRDVNIQRFTWDIDGNPSFGRPEKFVGFPAPSE